MGTLFILFFGLIFSLGGCKKDPFLGEEICKPKSRPKISDTGNYKNVSKIKGDWRLTNTVSYGDKDFLQYNVLADFLKNNNVGRKPVLKFKKNRKLLALGPVNRCYYNYYLTSKKRNKWLHTNWKNTLGCTAKLPPEEIISWEDNYQLAVMNSTCYKINNNTLTVQYYDNKEKYGKLIYEKVD